MVVWSWSLLALDNYADVARFIHLSPLLSFPEPPLCSACGKQFSATLGTIFASRKMAFVYLLAAICIWVNCAKGISALQLSRDLDCQYKTAFILAHKLREAMALGNEHVTLNGTVEIDSAYFGGHVRQENRKEDRKDRRLAANRDADRRVVVVLRQRQGRTLPFVVRRETEGAEIARARGAFGSDLHADEAPHWDELETFYNAHRIDHSIAFSADGFCTNQAESSRSPRRQPGLEGLLAAKLGCFPRRVRITEINAQVA